MINSVGFCKDFGVVMDSVINERPLLSNCFLFCFCLFPLLFGKEFKDNALHFLFIFPLFANEWPILTGLMLL